ncbi:tyrosine recombinase XerC, partial [Dickeya dadantii]|nr:tyrosine recombinase XerC [Dickeya dadantii]
MSRQPAPSEAASSSPLQTDVDAFLRYLKVERQLSPLTLTSYSRQLSAVITILSAAGIADWRALDASSVRSVVSRSKRDGLHSGSLALRLSALRSFLDWMVSRGVLTANPAKGVSTPRAGRPLPKNMDVDEVNRLLEID